LNRVEKLKDFFPNSNDKETKTDGEVSQALEELEMNAESENSKEDMMNLNCEPPMMTSYINPLKLKKQHMVHVFI
jgi:hypothetical protein